MRLVAAAASRKPVDTVLSPLCRLREALQRRPPVSNVVVLSVAVRGLLSASRPAPRNLQLDYPAISNAI